MAVPRNTPPAGRGSTDSGSLQHVFLGTLLQIVTQKVKTHQVKAQLLNTHWHIM